MEDLSGYLTARWDEEERVALGAADTPFDHPLLAPWEDARIRFRGSTGTPADLAVAMFANPAHVLAGIAAKRRILEACTTDVGPDEEGMANTVLGLLVQPYADRDDFREEWRL